MLRREAGPLAGWKLGVTSRAKQAQVGVHEPVRGHLAAADALDLGEPLVVAEHIQPRCEPEIVFVMGSDLSGPSVTSSAVLAATAAVAVGIEVLDSRYTDYKFTMPDVVADNTSAGRYVVGSAVPVAGLDLRLLGVVLEHNGEVVATASGAARIGPPGGRGRLAGPVAGFGERRPAGRRHRAVRRADRRRAGQGRGRGDRDGGPARLGGTRLRLMDPNGPGEPALVPLDRPPGRTQWTFSHAGRSFAVFEVPGDLVVTDGACPHNGGPLADGPGPGRRGHLPVALVQLRAGHRAVPDGGRLFAPPVSRGDGGRPAARGSSGGGAGAELVADPAGARPPGGSPGVSGALDHAAAARSLRSARRAGRTLDVLLSRSPGLSLADAYRIQDQMTALRLADGERLAGWKLGYTSAVMRAQMGIEAPNFGPLTDAMLLGSPAVLPAGALQPRVEPEIGLRLGRPLPGPVLG